MGNYAKLWRQSNTGAASDPECHALHLICICCFAQSGHKDSLPIQQRANYKQLQVKLASSSDGTSLVPRGYCLAMSNSSFCLDILLSLKSSPGSDHMDAIYMCAPIMLNLTIDPGQTQTKAVALITTHVTDHYGARLSTDLHITYQESLVGT